MYLVLSCHFCCDLLYANKEQQDQQRAHDAASCSSSVIIAVFVVRPVRGAGQELSNIEKSDLSKISAYRFLAALGDIVLSSITLNICVSWDYIWPLAAKKMEIIEESGVRNIEIFFDTERRLVNDDCTVRVCAFPVVEIRYRLEGMDHN